MESGQAVQSLVDLVKKLRFDPKAIAELRKGFRSSTTIC